MAKKPRFSVKQHVETGQALKDIERCSERISLELCAAYPLSPKALKRIIKASAMINLARIDLDQQMRIEHSGDFSQWPIDHERIYNGDVEDDLSGDEVISLIASTTNP